MQMHKHKKPYKLEERTYKFASDVRLFFHQMKRNTPFNDDIKQVLRSSGSIGANYIEANEALSKKDLLYRMKVCRKEAKETHYWLRLLKDTIDLDDDYDLPVLIQESFELLKIFSSIIEKIK